jgi:hypothetical protein
MRHQGRDRGLGSGLGGSGGRRRPSATSWRSPPRSAVRQRHCSAPPAPARVLPAAHRAHAAQSSSTRTALSDYSGPSMPTRSSNSLRPSTKQVPLSIAALVGSMFWSRRDPRGLALRANIVAFALTLVIDRFVQRLARRCYRVRALPHRRAIALGTRTHRAAERARGRRGAGPGRDPSA